MFYVRILAITTMNIKWQLKYRQDKGKANSPNEKQAIPQPTAQRERQLSPFCS